MTTITLQKGNIKLWVDFSLDKGRCKGCRKIIYWGSTLNGKKMPVSQNDKGEWVSHHFNDCVKAKAIFKPDDYIPRTNGLFTDEKWIPKI
ncbi:MAG: hypothetical protein WC389_16775 [Lutibacter sp.]|jgi:hypothetical protein